MTDLRPYMSWYSPRQLTTPPDGAAVGARVLFLRRSAGMRQSDLAERVGLTRTSISNIEAGRQALTPPVARLMSQVFEVSLDLLYGPRDRFYDSQLTRP